MTAAVIVGEKLTTMTTNSAIITSLATPVACGRHGQPRPGEPRDREEAGDGDAERDDGNSCDAGGTLPEPLEIDGEPGNERDERGREAIDDLELPGHRLRDHVAEVRTE